jgi:hypothetical protein
MTHPPATDAVLDEVRDRAVSLGGPLLVPLDGDSESPVLARLVESLGGSNTASLAVEAVREGFLCHHASSRVLALEDEDLALLVGDLLYAIGLRELAQAGDTGSVSILADLIRLVSERSEAGDRVGIESLWLAQTAALAVGSDERHRAALVALEAGEDPSAERLSDWSREVVESRGAGEALSEAAQGLQ